jgi:hypothetical protein
MADVIKDVDILAGSGTPRVFGASPVWFAMKLVSIPDNMSPDDVVTGKIRTPDGVELRFARLGVAGQ